MRQLVVEVTTSAIMEGPFGTRRQRINGLHKAMCQVVLDRHWPQGLGKEPSSGESVRLCHRLHTMISTIVCPQMPVKAALLRQGKSICQDVIYQKAVIVHRDSAKKELEDIRKRLAESVRVGLGQNRPSAMALAPALNNLMLVCLWTVPKNRVKYTLWEVMHEAGRLVKIVF